MHHLGKPRATREGWRVERGEAALDALEVQLSNSQWIANDQFSIADLALFAYTHLAEDGGFDLSSRPNITRWISERRSALALGN